ncbi:MAG: polysaccharide biosynthesis tyrosine autokinase [Alphaproteobacteria bacterium]|nr:polysaccharide biosynthesis tyrosine autokinase [Alphaproteobacteria bacterium]
MLKRASDTFGLGYPPAKERPQAAGANALDIAAYLAIARRRGPLVVACGMLAGLFGAIYALQLVPVYTATATMLLDTGQQPNLPVDPAFSGYIDDSKIESEIAIISSSDVAKRVAAKLEDANLPDEPASGPSVISLMKEHVVALFTGGSQKSERELVPEPESGDRFAASLQGGVSVARQGFSYVIAISYTSPNPAFAAAVANGFVDEYLVDQLETRYESTKRTTDWLNDRLRDLRVKVRDSERAVEVFKTQNNIVEAEGTSLSDQQVSKLNEQLILARAEAAQAKATYDQVQAAAARGKDLTSFADPAQAAAIGALRAKASEVRRELAEAAVKYGNRHPTVVALRAQITDIDRQVGNETARTVTAAENKYRVALSREQSIATSLNALKGGVSATNQAEITLRELEREAQANKALFESFLSKFKETSQAETLQSSSARIIERAKPPTSPSAPKRSRIALIWLAAGLAIGGGIAFLLEQLDRGFHNSKQVEDGLGVPVLASIPKADADEGLGLFGALAARFNALYALKRLLRLGGTKPVGRDDRKRLNLSNLAVKKPLSTFTEAIRALRMGIRFVDVDRPRKIILFSSALPGEGKSTLASNLAQHAAVSGERVVLIDMDLRHPALSQVYAPQATKGVVDVALGEAELKHVLRFDKATGLSILPAPVTHGLTHSAEILGSRRIKEMLQQLSSVFDLVIIDASPLLPVTDGRVLIDYVDAMVLVVKWEETKRDAVEAALDLCYGLDDKLIGVALNDVVPSRARHYGYYKSGHYMNKYPDYYGGKG